MHLCVKIMIGWGFMILNHGFVIICHEIMFFTCLVKKPYTAHTSHQLMFLSKTFLFFFSDVWFIWLNHGFVISLSLNHDFQTIFPSPNFIYIPDWWEVMLSDVKLPSGQLHGSISFVTTGLLLIFLTRLIIYVNVSLYLFLSIYLSIYLSILLSISAYFWI